MRGRVLIYRPGSLGDTVVALPCLKLVRKAFPEAELRVLTHAPVASSAPPLAAVVEGMGLVDGYLEYPVPLTNPGNAWQLARAIRRWRPDMLVYLARRETPGQVRRDAAFFRLCGIRKIIGLPTTPDLLKNRRLPGGTFEREAERLARTVALLGDLDPADPTAFDLALGEADRALPRRLISERIGRQPFIAVSIGTKQPANDWGLGNWRELCVQLCRLYPHRLALTGAEEDRAPSDAVIQGLGERAVNLCGLKVRENAALIEAASLFVGHDSGPMHLAAAVGTPLAAIFSRLWAPGIWYPMSAQAAVLYPQGDSIGAITPPMVLDAIRTLLPVHKLAGER
ncbi:MAG TPA: glycosyltransferase family 9 protein [Alphaproteobacteria bacterium]|jgi:ADP-heptose:LPS heptosyltransferase|nr:glycosyltransferase family 9 protein [Alphaproteobacteria bacterium]